MDPIILMYSLADVHVDSMMPELLLVQMLDEYVFLLLIHVVSIKDSYQ